jgi:hypothetical protein
MKSIVAVAFILFPVTAGLLAHIWTEGGMGALTGSIQAFAKAEPIIVFDSGYNRDWAVNACWPFRKEVAPPEADPAAVYDCQWAANTRGLGRELENDVRSKFAVTTRCKGVTVILPEFDNNFSYKQVVDIQKPHWLLILYYQPGSKVYGWALFQVDSRGNLSSPANILTPYKVVKGEGTPAQIADEVCIVVTGQGATVQ